MIPIDIPEIKTTLYIPTSIDELDDRQYADIAKAFAWFQMGQINLFEFRTLGVYALLGLKAEKTKYKSLEDIPEQDFHKWENIFRLSEILDSFFEEEITEDGVKQLKVKQYFTRNFLPKYRLLKKYDGPEDGFTDSTFGQYLDGLEEFIYFSQNGDLKSLQMLFSIFYLPKNEEYSYKKSKERATTWFKHTDIRHVFGFYMFFTSMQLYFQSGEIEVMGNKIDLSLIYQEVTKGKVSEIAGIGMHGVLNDLAESGVFGPAESVRKTNLWTILLRLYELKKKEIDDNNTSPKNESKTT